MTRPTLLTVARWSLYVLEAGVFYVRGLIRKMREDDILFLASGLAFNGILTLIPLLLLAASGIGIFLSSSSLALQQVHGILNAVFPAQPFATSIKDSILAMISDIITFRTSLGLFGILVLVWTATSLFDGVRSVLHTIYRIPRTKGLLAGLLHDVGFVVLLFVLFLMTSVSIWTLSLLEGIAVSVPALASFDFSWVDDTIPTVIIVILTTWMFYIVYRFIPDSRPPKSAGLISTVMTTILWVVSARVFSIFLSEFSSIGKVYGSYAFILVLLIWVYYSSMIFIIGGMIGQLYWERIKLREAGKLSPP